MTRVLAGGVSGVRLFRDRTLYPAGPSRSGARAPGGRPSGTRRRRGGRLADRFRAAPAIAELPTCQPRRSSSPWSIAPKNQHHPPARCTSGSRLCPTSRRGGRHDRARVREEALAYDAMDASRIHRFARRSSEPRPSGFSHMISSRSSCRRRAHGRHRPAARAAPLAAG
jgi:hypothetical protein